MQSHIITIPGDPIPKPRPKGWFNQKTKHMHHYYKNEKVIKGFENQIKEKAFELFDKPIEGPVKLEVVFIFPRPKNKIWKRKLMPREWKITKPDFENLLKSVGDALNGIGYRDDAQVVDGSWKKYIASGDEIPRTIISIKELRDGE